MSLSTDLSRGFLLRTGSNSFDSRFSVTFFAQAKKGDQLISESMSCDPLSRRPCRVAANDSAVKEEIDSVVNAVIGARMRAIVLGAGASKSYSASSTGCRMPIARDFFPTFNQLSISSNPWVIVGAVINQAKEFYEIEPIDFVKADFDIEEFHSQVDELLRSAQQTDDRVKILGYSKVNSELTFLFASVINEIQNGPPSATHRRLAQLLDANDIILTFNWDSLMERALKAETDWSADSGYGFQPKEIFRDGWVPGSSSRSLRKSPFVLKLHGSANWLTGLRKLSEDGRTFESTQSSEIDSVYCFEYATKPYDTYDGRYMAGYSEFSYGYYPPNLSDVGKQLPEGRAVFSARYRFPFRPKGTSGEAGLLSIPLIIPPVKNKEYDAFGSLFSGIWANALRALSGADHIVVIGYSFPRTDHKSNELFTKAFMARSTPPRVTIIDPFPERVAHKFEFELGVPADKIDVRKEGWTDASDITGFLKG